MTVPAETSTLSFYIVVEEILEIEVTINGESHRVAAGTTVAGLLAKLGKEPRFLAVERNSELIPRSQHPGCVLSPNDQIEIVTLVGGG